MGPCGGEKEGADGLRWEILIYRRSKLPSHNHFNLIIIIMIGTTAQINPPTEHSQTPPPVEVRISINLSIVLVPSRQITPPTESNHAAPHAESRKSYRSVNS